jgi:hypothetical protein
MSNELVKELIVTAEVSGTDLSEAAATMIVSELESYERSQVMGALRKCRRELKGRLTLAAIIERLDDGRPGAEEAWSMIPKNEDTSVVWSDEMALAFGIAGSLIADGDMIAARMAFKESYTRMVADARDARKPVNWTPSLGHDPRGRAGALLLAVEKGRLTMSQAEHLGLGYDGPVSQDMMALVYGGKQ